MEFNLKNFFLSAIAITAIGGVSYAIYFDYKRRNDAKFRRTLKKKNKEVEKKIQKEEVTVTEEKVVDKKVRYKQLYDKIKADQIPESQKEVEAYLFYNLSMAEQLATKGPAYYEECACAVIRAALVVPNAVEIILLFKNMLPEECYEIVSSIYALELEQMQVILNDYYIDNPAPEMNVKLVEAKVQRDVSAAVTFKDYELATMKEFAEGDEIYTELPVITTLEPAYEGKGFCGNCLKELSSEEEVKPTYSYLKSNFCSKACLEASKIEYIEESLIKSPEAIQILEESYKTGKKIPVTMARVLNKVFKEHSIRTAKNLPKEKYTIMQHVERLAPIDFEESDDVLTKELDHLRQYVSVETQGIEHVVDLAYYKNMKSKIGQGILGFSTIKSEDKVVENPLVPEGIKIVTEEPVNAFGLYVVSGFLAASKTEANVKAVFKDGNHKLSLVALKPIQTGDVLYLQTYGQVEEEKKIEVVETLTIETKEEVVVESKEPLELFEAEMEKNLLTAEKIIEDAGLEQPEEELEVENVKVEEKITFETSSHEFSSQEFEKIDESNSTPGFDTPPHPESPQ